MSYPTSLLTPFVLLITAYLAACSSDEPDVKVSAKAISDTEIAVEWKIEDEESFDLVRTGGVGERFPRLTSSGSMTDSGLQSSRTYCYQLIETSHLLQGLEGPLETSNKACARTFLCLDKPDCDNATTYTTGDEIEPNNSIDQSETRVYFFSPYRVTVFKGTVNDSTDIEDYQKFSFSHDIPAAIYICAGITGCEFQNGSIYQGQEIAIELLDSFGNLIDSTYQADPANGNTIRYAMEDGERYYVVVRAIATTGADFEYSLFITDERAKTFF